jgi:hypothetical protein
VTWLLAHAPPAVQYRTLRDIGRFKSSDPRLGGVPFASRQGMELLLRQDSDGTWSGGMLAVPKVGSFDGVGTIVAYRRLVELGWDPESPGLACTKRLLFRLLAEDNDPSYLSELMPEAPDEDLITDRVGAYLRSPLAAKPWIRLGNQHVLPAEVHAPSFHTLIMLAHMPHFRSEHHEVMDRLYTYLTTAWPRQVAVQQIGTGLIDQPHLVLGDFLPTRNVMDADMPSALAWLETMARLGFLRRHEGWSRLLDRLLDDRDRKGIWHPPRSVAMPEVVPAWSWSTMPLADGTEPLDLSVDVTFRLGLIAKLSGRQIDLV